MCADLAKVVDDQRPEPWTPDGAPGVAHKARALRLGRVVDAGSKILARRWKERGYIKDGPDSLHRMRRGCCE
jgi:hypothetical protein